MSIVVCVPWVKAHKKFMPHFIEWYAFNKGRHDLRLHFEIYRPLHEVQHEAVELARRLKSSHVLFIEDDHWGFPVDGLDVLLEEDKPAIGFHTIRKQAPFKSLAMQKIDPTLTLIGKHRNLKPHDRGDGPEVQATDVLTWAFTLVQTAVFDRLEAVGKDPFYCFGPVPTDSFFNQYCEDEGIPRHVHFGTTIAHGDHNPEDLDILKDAYAAIQRRNIRKRRPVGPQEGDQQMSPEALHEMARAFHERNAAVPA